MTNDPNFHTIVVVTQKEISPLQPEPPLFPLSVRNGYADDPYDENNENLYSSSKELAAI